MAVTFAFEQVDGSSLGEVARIDTMVSVVDASTFLDEVHVEDLLADRDLEAAPEDDRALANLLVDQVEFADVLVVNKVDLAGPERVAAVEAALRALNPEAARQRIWDPSVGDRRQELVFIGQDLDVDAVHRALEGALLDDEELALGPDGWVRLGDPLPPWDVSGDGYLHDHDDEGAGSPDTAVSPEEVFA